jgi:hypothetical protein
MADDDPQWDWWRAATQNPPVRGPINANEPMSGFYGLRRKDRATGVMLTTVAAFWRDPAAYASRGLEAPLHCKHNRRMLGELEALELWPFAAKTPITHDRYRAFMATGNWVKIIDYRLCLSHFAEDAKVVELIRQLANAAAVAGVIPAGCQDPTKPKP